MVSVMLYPCIFPISLLLCQWIVCFVCYVSGNVCELLGDTIRNVFGCGCYFIVNCYGVV